MKINKRSVLVTGYGVLIVAACNGKLVVDSGGGHLDSQDAGTMGSGGATIGSGGATPGTAGSATGVGGTSAGGATAANGGSDSGGASAGGGAAGGATICVEAGGTFGDPSYVSAAGGSPGAPPTNPCPVDGNGIAASDFPTLCSTFRCPSSAADLLTGLTCTEVTTDRTGFTKTVGCGTETVEFHSDDEQSVYAASFDLSTGTLAALTLHGGYSFAVGGPTDSGLGACTAFGFQAGPSPAACPDAVTYRCQHSPLTGAAESAYAGCREPSEPGCAKCCTPGVAPYADWCTVLSTALGSTTHYDVQDSVQSLCACGCSPCARCAPNDEMNLRTAVVRADCDCSKVDAPTTGTGGSGGGGDPCIPYCSIRNAMQAKCPGI